jgi:hypothetical protein
MRKTEEKSCASFNMMGNRAPAADDLVRALKLDEPGTTEFVLNLAAESPNAI